MPNNLIIPDSVDKAAQNLSDAPSKAIGNTLADLWQLALGGRVAYAVEKQKMKYAYSLEEYRKTLEQKVDDIPSDKQIDPDLQIAAQALEDSKYCVESEELRDLFANLIARAMHADYADKIHPSFSKIAQQLSPLDAQMLTIMRYANATGGIAIADYVQKPSDHGYVPLLECVPESFPDGCDVTSVSRSLGSLQRLGLIHISMDTHFTDENRYHIFYESFLYVGFEKLTARDGCKLDINKGVARLTLLGNDFVNVCLD